MGWLYGSISEDVPTGLNMHRKGWRSECCTPVQTAFKGCAPVGLLTTMIQQKRWASGLTVVFFGRHSPVMGTLFGKIQIRAGLSYCWLTNWGLRSVFEVCYAALVAYCIITNSNIFPKVSNSHSISSDKIKSIVEFNDYALRNYMFITRSN